MRERGVETKETGNQKKERERERKRDKGGGVYKYDHCIDPTTSMIV